MHDILFRLPVPFTDRTFPIHSYGVMAMLGFLAGVLVARWRARKAGLSADAVTDIGLWALLAGLAGSRLLYVLENAGYYFDTSRPGWSALDVFKIWEGGLVFYGGFIGAFIAVVLAARKRGLRLLAVLDVIAPSLALGHAFGRIGCFLRGCCYGVPLRQGTWYGVVFPPGAPAYDPHGPRSIPPSTPVFPTQLVSALDLFAIFVVLHLFFAHRRAEGQVSGLYLVLYSVHRFVIEFFRADTHLPGKLSAAQWLSLLVFFVGLGMLVYLRGPTPSAREAGRSR